MDRTHKIILKGGIYDGIEFEVPDEFDPSQMRFYYRPPAIAEGKEITIPDDERERKILYVNTNIPMSPDKTKIYEISPPAKEVFSEMDE